MHKKTTRLTMILGLMASLANHAPAQSSRGTVTGVITDPSGAAVPAAAIDLRNIETGVVRSSRTNDSGLYRFDAVDLGTYQVVVNAPGFRSLQTSRFDVAAGQVATVDGRLEIGEQQNVIQVTDETAVLQAEAPVRGANLNTQEVRELPFANRNPVTLALTVPGVATNRFAFGVGTFSVNGSRGRSNNFLIDGTENNDISVAGQAFQVTNPDAVQEVAIQTSNYDSEYGRAGGAVINTITKSGTNGLHGTASYLIESTFFDATTNQQAKDPAVQQRGHPLPGTDQWFAGTLGGPIKKDRTFYFGSFQEERQTASGSATITTPSPAGRATLNSLFPKGKNANVDLFNTVTANSDATSDFFPVALGSGRPAIEFGTATFSFPQTFRDRLVTIKLDHKLGDNDQLSGRFLFDDQFNPAASVTYPGFTTTGQNRYQNALISETHVFSPSMTNEIRLPYNRIAISFPLNPANPLGTTAPGIQIATIAPAAASFPVPVNIPQGRIANNYGFQDTFTWVHGSHSIRAGLDLLDQRSRQFAPIVPRGLIIYSSGGGFTGFANFVDDFGGSGPAVALERDFGSPAYYPALFRQAYFVQDRWRATANLTLTLGVRYEDFGVPENNIRTPAYTGLFNVDPVTLQGPYSQPNKVKSDRNNFAPGIGIAYTPVSTGGVLGKLLGDRKTVIRGGYQIGYDSFFNNIASNAQSSSPNIIATTFSSTVSAANPRGTPNFSSLLPMVAKPLSPYDAQTLVDPNLVNPYYQRWSLGIQREMPGNLLLDVSYVGSKGTKLFTTEDFNPVVPASLQRIPANFPAGTRNSGRYDPLQGARAIRTNNGSSYYESGQANLHKRFTHGLFGNVAYTYSKLIDYGSEIFAQGNNTPSVSAVPTIFGGLPREKAVSLFDRTHRLIIAYGYQLPFMQSQRGFLGRVVGGWEVSGITTFESGVPFTISNGQDADGLDGSNDRPDFNPLGRKNTRAVPSAASPTGYIDPDAGGAPVDPAKAMYIGIPANTGSTPARTGNLGRNTWRTPGTNNFNLNILKNIKIDERFHAELRTEFFNLFNHPQFGQLSVSAFDINGTTTISGNVFNSAAGRFLDPRFADGGSRVVRFQLKILW